MNRSLTVLITGAGSPGAPGVIASLRSVKDMSLQIIGMDMNADASGRGLADHFIQGPEATDANYVIKLLDICARYQIDVILPLVSKELPIFAQHHDKFSEIGTMVSVSEINALKTAMNKGVLLHFMEKDGFPVPKYEIVQTAEDLKRAIKHLGYPNEPVCFKPVVSDGSRGFRILDARKNRFELLFHEKPTSVYLSETELLNVLEGREDIPETVVMEYLPNEEYSVDILSDHGHVLIAIPRLRQKIESGISVKSKIVKADDVIQYTSKVVKALGLHGNIGVQVRRDKSGEPKMIEINPRIQGTIVHCTAAGVNLPYLAVKLAKGYPIKADEQKIHWGLEMVRYWKEVFFSDDGTIIKF
ncbi:MAG: ATP-grasp domain-containing protein [Tuberibacillus sp.]